MASTRHLVVAILSLALTESALGADPPPGRSLGTITIRATPADLKLSLADANPRFLPQGLASALYPSVVPGHGRRASLAEAVQYMTPVLRRGAVADGESRLLVVASVNQPGRLSFALRSPAADGEAVHVVEAEGPRPAARDTEAIGRWRNVYQAYALYTPPKAFGEPLSPAERPSETLKRRGRGLAYRPVEVEVRFQPADGASPVVRTQTIELFRPAVVLVHGTYDEGTLCWDWADDDTYRQQARRDASAGGRPSPYDTDSLVRQLEGRGFPVFIVNYKLSSGVDRGAQSVEGGAYASHFHANARVVWEGGRPEPEHDGTRGEGIRHAVSFFRDRDVAATQADVVGHSMGGVLPRVYARGVPLSEAWRASDNWYLRPDNWMQGDINRLITIGATHRGSHVPRLSKQYWQHQGRLAPVSWAWWHVRTGFKLGEGAFEDQDPGSVALRAIGATRLPVHTIGAVASASDLNKFDVGVTDPSYRDRFMLLWPHTPEDFLDTLFAGHAAPHDGRADADDLRKMLRAIGEKRAAVDGAGPARRPLEQEEAMLERAERESSPQMQQRVRERLADVRLRLRPFASLQFELEAAEGPAFLRYVAAAFWNDWTDYTSSLDSQLNGQDPGARFVTVLPRNFEVACEGILHGYEPRHRAIQQRVMMLLAGGMAPFAPGLDTYQDPVHRREGQRRWTPYVSAACQPPDWSWPR